jgi:hypothetical protein
MPYSGHRAAVTPYGERRVLGAYFRARYAAFARLVACVVPFGINRQSSSGFRERDFLVFHLYEADVFNADPNDVIANG